MPLSACFKFAPGDSNQTHRGITNRRNRRSGSRQAGTEKNSLPNSLPVGSFSLGRGHGRSVRGRRIGHRKNTTATWQRRAGLLDRSDGAPALRLSACFCAFSRKIGGQELFPYQTSARIYLEGRVRGCRFFESVRPSGEFRVASLSKTAGVRALREGLIQRLKQLLRSPACTDGVKIGFGGSPATVRNLWALAALRRWSAGSRGQGMSAVSQPRPDLRASRGGRSAMRKVVTGGFQPAIRG